MLKNSSFLEHYGKIIYFFLFKIYKYLWYKLEFSKSVQK